MSVRISITLLLSGSLVAAVAACATPQPPQAHDVADRLFLKLAEVAQRSTPVTVRDTEELIALVDEIPTSGDACMSKNVAALESARTIVTTAEDVKSGWTEQSFEMRRELKHLQSVPLTGAGCDGRGFPNVQID
jgi:hypothetical protein